MNKQVNSGRQTDTAGCGLGICESFAPLFPLNLNFCDNHPRGCWVDNYCTLRVKLLYRNVIHCKLCVNTTSNFHDPLHHFLRRGNSSPTMHPCPLVSGHLLGAQSLTTAAVMAKGALSSATCPHLVIKAYTTLLLGS